MISIRRAHLRGPFIAASLMLLSTAARADLSDPQILNQLAPLERAAALANQAVYNSLTIGTNPVCSDENVEPLGACSGTVFQVFDNVRELVQTANALGNSGPTRYSLGLDVRGLGSALRWTAAEELSAQRSAATEFSNSQLGAVLGRLSALRFGAIGAHTLQFSQQYGSTFEFDGAVPLSLFGVADEDDTIARKLSAFINGSYGYGNKRDTTYRGGYEDAFDFDSMQATLGVDYRLSPKIVAGALLGLARRKIDFDSRASVVDGGIDSNGASLTLYGQWETDQFYVSASLGGQRLKHNMDRRITYPSFNPLIPSIDSLASGSTHSTGLIGTFNVGYDFHPRGLTIEPYLKGDYLRVQVNSFSETDSSGFAFSYGGQTIRSFDTAAGAKMQRVFTPPFAVIVPYFRADFHRELEPAARKISALYDGLNSLGALANAGDFSVPTDRQDTDYFQLAGGASLVMRHGLQGFLQFQQTLGLRPFTDRAISGGLRLEF